MAFHFVMGFLSREYCLLSEGTANFAYRTITLAVLLYQAFDSAFVSFLAVAIYAKSYMNGEHVRAESDKKSGRSGEA